VTERSGGGALLLHYRAGKHILHERRRESEREMDKDGTRTLE